MRRYHLAFCFIQTTLRLYLQPGRRQPCFVVVPLSPLVDSRTREDKRDGLGVKICRVRTQALYHGQFPAHSLQCSSLSPQSCILQDSTVLYTSSVSFKREHLPVPYPDPSSPSCISVMAQQHGTGICWYVSTFLCSEKPLIIYHRWAGRPVLHLNCRDE